MDSLLPYGGVKVSESPFWIDMVTIVQTKVCYKQIKAGLGSIMPVLSGKHGPWLYGRGIIEGGPEATSTFCIWVINGLLELGKLSSDSATVFVSICFH